MAKKNPPTVRMRRLGAALRTIRDERGLTLDEAAELLNISKSALNRMENAQVITRPHEVDYLLIRYEVTDDNLRASLMGLAKAGRSKEWIKRHSFPAAHPVADDIGLEQDASAICEYQPIAVPVLLQTPNYARAVLTSTDATAPAHTTDGEVAFHLARQEVLSRPDPPRLRVIIGEAALRQRIGGADVMTGQLRHLLEASRQANIVIGVLPFTATANPGFNSPFSIMNVEPGDFTVVITGSHPPDVHLDDDTVRHYTAVFENLSAMALSPADSRVLMEDALRQIQTRPGEGTP